MNFQRAAGELDNEIMELTASLLAVNPDFYTLWNIRRQVFSKWRREAQERESREDTTEYFQTFSVEVLGFYSDVMFISVTST